MSTPWYVYCLATCDEPFQTYIGATTDPDRRLSQHNSGRKAGGARRTAGRPNNWYRVCYVEGFPDNHTALSFEWHWKHFSRKLKGDPLEKRQKGLDTCLEWAFAKLSLPELKVVYE